MHLAQRDDDLRVGDGIADSQPGESVGLGERTEHHDVGSTGGEYETVRELVVGGAARVLEIGFVERDDDVVGDGIEELLEFVLAEIRASGCWGCTRRSAGCGR